MRGYPGTTQHHGTHARHVAGCRCAPCRAANVRYQKIRAYDRHLGHPRRVPSVGTRRRLRSLAAIGWPVTEIAQRLGGVTRQYAQQLRSTPCATVERRTAEVVEALYASLSMRPGPSVRSRLYALTQGWAPPLAWDDIDDPAATPDLGASTDTGVDPVAIERAIAGDAITLTHAERVEAVRIAAARGYSDAEIAQRLRITARTVQRIRTEHNILSRWNEAA